jgi:hypothetical protein
MWIAVANPEDPITLFSWAQFGVTGLVIVAALFGWIWFKPAVERLLSDLDACSKKLDQRDEIIRTIIVPAVTESNTLLKEVAEYMGILARRNAA